jgi:hypothetical protein
MGYKGVGAQGETVRWQSVSTRGYAPVTTGRKIRDFRNTLVCRNGIFPGRIPISIPGSRSLRPHPFRNAEIVRLLTGIHLTKNEGLLMSEAQSSDAMKSLVIVIIKLAILGAILALAGHFLVELPIQQAAVHVPTNAPFT